MIKSINILGGGTAGLIAALMLRASYDHLDITIIESSEYGIVGVGEGSTEHWKTFMDHANIDIYDLFKETGATFKTGIRFENWHGDGTEYWHSLPEFVSFRDHRIGLFPTMAKIIAEGSDPMRSVYYPTTISEHAEPYHAILNQYHFDTRKLNSFFHKLCSERNIKIIDDIIDDVEFDDNGFVKSLIGKKGKYISDFFIDSSGFRRVISSKMGTEWVDCSKYLPMNSAFAAPTPYQEEIPSHTLARALSSGWMWRIPTQERFGNGYVFCDNFISDEDAEKEFRSQFSHPIEIAKKFKFTAGYVNKFWNKNCLSIGLSGMFVEPLEASSIGSTIQQMFGLCAEVFYWDKNNSTTEKRYNEIFTRVATNIVDFIQLHYFTKRNDSEFWKWAKTGIELTDFHKEHLEEFKTNLPGLIHFDQTYLMFKDLNYMQVMHGLDLFDQPKVKERIDKFAPYAYKLGADNLKFTDDFVKVTNYVSHRTAINEILKRQSVVKYDM